METFHNATVKMIDTLKSMGQSDSEATIEVGVAMGIAISLLVFTGASLCVARMRKPVVNAGITAPSSLDAAAVNGAASEADVEQGTEGAYRSDTESDDELQNRKIARQAQKRSRNTHGV